MQTSKPKLPCTDVFVTSTFRNDWNREFNVALCAALEGQGFAVFLPQRDSQQTGNRARTFAEDVEGLRQSRCVVAIGTRMQSANWGFEIGMAYALNKPVLILTDTEHPPELMTEGAMSKLIVPASIEAIDSYLDELVAAIRSMLL